jgi:uncharacterized protein (TIGR00255 family)
MTGQGHASEQSPAGLVRVEVRTVNNRGLKIIPSLSDCLAMLEPKLEAVVRNRLRRGSVHLSVRMHRPAAESVMQIDQAALGAYIDQIRQVHAKLGDSSLTIEMSGLLLLPGVISGIKQGVDESEVWPSIEKAVHAALDNLNEMRRSEGVSMAVTLLAECEIIAAKVDTIRDLAPRAALRYAERLEAKIQRILGERNLETQPIDLLREVQVYADRSDVSEEVTRLGSHLEMFREVLGGGKETSQEPVGRKLDFIVQEMFREANTTGSKAADAEVSSEVVEIKCALERIRELIQNLE